METNKELNTKLKMLIKSEQALLNIELQKRSRQTILVAIGLLSVLISLIMLNVTTYLFFEDIFSSIISAAILTGLNLSFAVLFFKLAQNQKAGAEVEALKEMRDYAWEQVTDDIEEIKQSAVEFKNSVNRIKNNVDLIATGDFLGFKTVIPIIQTFFNLKKSK